MTLPPEELVLDAGHDRADAWLRLVGALVVLPAGIYLVSDGGTPMRWTFALAAWGAAFGWMASFVRRMRAKPPAVGLALDANGLTFRSGETIRHVRWADVRRVDVDEEALVVQVEVDAEPPLTIPAGLGRLGLADLALRIEGHRPGARGPDPR